MANRYWRGGSGTWNTTSTTNWSTVSGGPGGASVPTAADDVIIDGASGSPTVDLTIPFGTFGSLNCKSLTTLGATCTLKGLDPLNVFGNITLSSTTTFFNFQSLVISAISNITTNGAVVNTNIFSAFSITLGDSLTLGTTKRFEFTAGTLSLSNFTLSTGDFYSSGTRVFAFGTGNITVTGAGNALNISGTNLTYTGTPTVNINNNTASAFSSVLSGFTQNNALNINYVSGTYSLTYNDNIVRNLNFTGFNGTVLSPNSVTVFGNLTLSTTATYQAASATLVNLISTSGTQVITTNGVNFPYSISQNAAAGTVQLGDGFTNATNCVYTLFAGTLNLNNFNLNSSIFNSTSAVSRIIQFGSASIILKGTSTVFNVNGTNLTYTGIPNININNNAGASIFAKVDTGFSENNAFNFKLTGNFNFAVAGSNTNNFFKSLDFTGFTGNWNFLGRIYILYGSLTLVPGMTISNDLSGSGYIFDNTSGTATLTSAGKILPAVTQSGNGGTLALSGDTTISNDFTFIAGTLQLPANTTTTVGSFGTTGTTLKYLTSSVSGTQATLSDLSGTNSVTYLSIKDNNATGGATWDNSSTTNILETNVTGWIKSSGLGNFFLLF